MASPVSIPGGTTLTDHPQKVSPLFGDGLRYVNQIGQYVNTVSQRAYNILRLAASVVDDETFTINKDVYEIDIINTSSTVSSASGQANHATGNLTLTITAHGQKAGNLVRCENEIMRITSVVDANTVFIAAHDRGACGTTKAAHADGNLYYVSDSAAEVNASGHIPVGLVATLTATAAQAAIVGTINDHPASYNPNSTMYAAVAVTDGAVKSVVVTTAVTGKIAWACSETLTGSGNAWDNATFVGGADPQHQRSLKGNYVPTAGDVTNGVFHIVTDFAAVPTYANVAVRVSSTGVVKAWDGALSFSAASAVAGVPIIATLDNSGSTDWATTDTIYFNFAE